MDAFIYDSLGCDLTDIWRHRSLIALVVKVFTQTAWLYHWTGCLEVTFSK